MLDWEWELQITRKPMELGEAYELYFFLGSVPSSPSDWRYAPSRVFEPILSWGETTTTEYRLLNGYLKLHSKRELKDADVIPYLRNNLTWRAKKLYEDKTIKNSKLESLKIVVHGPKGPITLTDGTSCRDTSCRQK